MYFHTGLCRVLTERYAQGSGDEGLGGKGLDSKTPPLPSATNGAGSNNKQTSAAFSANNSHLLGSNIPAPSTHVRFSPQHSNGLTASQIWIDMKENEDASLFIGVTRNALHLWSCKPEIMLSKIVRSEKTIQEDGENHSVIWCNFQDQVNPIKVLILTDRGYLHFYDIFISASPLIEFENQVQSSAFRFLGSAAFSTSTTPASSASYISGAGEGGGIPSLTLRFRMALEIDSGVTCGVACDFGLLLCTRNPATLLSLNWSGDLDEEGTQSLRALPFLVSFDDPFSQMEFCPKFGVFGFLSFSGEVYVCRRNQKLASASQDETPSNPIAKQLFDGFNLKRASAAPYATGETPCRIAFNPLFPLISVGTTFGNIFVYDINTGKLLHTSSLSSVIGRPTVRNSNPITCLKYSSDGFALASCSIPGGLNVWSVYGRLLLGCTSEEPPLAEDFSTGIICCFWSRGDFDLMVLPSNLTGEHGSGTDIYAFSFAKSCAVSNFNDCNASHSLLLGDEFMLAYDRGTSQMMVEDTESINWQFIHYPVLYLYANWPIRSGAIDSSGNRIAIAGERGFAIYTVSTRSWKLFGNEQQEQSFMVPGPMVWLYSLLVISCWTIGNGSNQIVFYRRDGNLELSRAVYRENLPCPILAMNTVTEKVCVLLLKNGEFRFYSLVGSGKSSRIQLKVKKFLSSLIPKPFEIRALSCVHHLSFLPERFELETIPIIFLKYGQLFVLNTSSAGDSSIDLLNSNVESIWIAKGHPTQYLLHSSIWGFDSQGVHIWKSSPSDILTCDTRKVYLKLGFSPLSVLLEDGILLGLEPKPSLRKSLEYPHFKLETITHLFIPDLLQNLLNQGQKSDAIAFSAPYKDLEYFSHALELLLHAIVEEITSSGTPSANMLSTVLEFLEYYPNYLEVIVRYARKSEISVWQTIFAIVGDPKLLFQRCLDKGAMDTATSYLIIIQTLEPAAVSAALAENLVLKVFESEDFESARELLRYLKSIQGDFAVPWNSTNSINSRGLSSPTLIAQNSSSFESYLDTLIAKHARTLLASYRVRTLFQFRKAIGFNLKEWLKSERTKSALIQNWFDALGQLHAQYQLPFPVFTKEHETVAPRSRIATIENRGHGIPRDVIGVKDKMVQKGSGDDAIISANRILLERRHSKPEELNGTFIDEESPEIPSIPRQSISIKTSQSANVDGHGLFIAPSSSRSGDISSSQLSKITGGMGKMDLATSADLPSNAPPLLKTRSSVDYNSYVDETQSIAPQLTLAYESANTALVLEGIQEIREWIPHMVEAKCSHWSILLSTLLLDTSYLVSVFPKNEEMFQLWRQVLLETKSTGYAQLVDQVTRALGWL